MAMMMMMMMMMMLMLMCSAIYSQQMGEDSRSALNCNVIATRVLPSLIPFAVSPALNISQVCLWTHFYRFIHPRGKTLLLEQFQYFVRY